MALRPAAAILVHVASAVDPEGAHLVDVDGIASFVYLAAQEYVLPRNA